MSAAGEVNGRLSSTPLKEVAIRAERTPSLPNRGAEVPLSPGLDPNGPYAGVAAASEAPRPAASRNASARSVRSQVKSWSSRPKWP